MTENTNNIPTPYFSVGEEVILESFNKENVEAI